MTFYDFNKTAMQLKRVLSRSAVRSITIFGMLLEVLPYLEGCWKYDHIWNAVRSMTIFGMLLEVLPHLECCSLSMSTFIYFIVHVITSSLYVFILMTSYL